MRNTITRNAVAPLVLAVVALLLTATPAAATIDGEDYTAVQGPVNIALFAKADFVTSADGGSIPFWGLSATLAGRAQYPAPTLILAQGQTVNVTVTNQLGLTGLDYSHNTSLVFPGHDVSSCSGAPGVLTCEAAPGGSATYTFVADQPGTYTYHSGTDAALQVEMGILGAIVVRPYGYNANSPTAYGHPDSSYDREYLFVLSEMDPDIHNMVAFGDAFLGTDSLGDYFSKYWFINGRTGPDTMAEANVPWLPTQPYNILPRMNPGDRVLARIVSAGRESHPYHVHGNHADVIARNGRMLSSAPGAGADLRYEVFTFQAVPGNTYDGIFEWTGENLGWDIYGSTLDGQPAHDCTDVVDNETGLPLALGPANPYAPGDGYADAGSDYPWEWCDDHNKRFPVTLPANQDLTFGGFWSGSPYMGAAGALPPGEGGLNPNSGYTYMWHSHTEKELTNNDIFPGGMMTMLIVEPPGVQID